ncbi:MAG: CBS domain-containing protein [Candidatus Moraniibacteriota bacterium]
MRSEVVSVAPDQLVQDVADVLMKRSIHGVPVIDAEDKVVGIVTESDFFMKDRATLHIPSFMDIMQKTMVAKALGDADRAIIERILSARVKDIMTSECLTVYEVTPLQDLLQIFATTHYKTVPVVDGSRRLVGVVTVTDMLSAITPAASLSGGGGLDDKGASAA